MLTSIESGPTDRGNIIWLLSFAVGVAQLFPWNAYLTASLYFIKQFPKFPFLFAMPIAYNWANIATLFLMTRFGSGVFVRTRMRMSFAVSFAMLLIVPGINMLKISESIRIGVCLGATFFAGFATAVMTGTGFSALAVLPPQYTTALMVGQGLSGVFNGGLQLLLEFVIYPKNTDHEIYLSGIIFFAVAAAVIVLCTICNEFLLNSDFYRFYADKADLLDSNIQDLNSEESGLIGQEQVTLMGVFKKIWPDALSVFLVFLVSLTIFPGFTISIPNYDKRLGPLTNDGTSRLPTILIALFQLCDMIGRSLPQLVLIPKRFLLLPTLLRAGFIALWMLMNYTKIFASNLYAYFFMIAMALTNGYFSTLGMMFGPSRVSPAEAGTAGMLMAFFLQFGVFSGVHSAMLILFAIKGPSEI